MSLLAQEKNTTACSTAKLLAEFEQRNRSKAQARPDLGAAYAHTATEFRRALHLHVGECAACLTFEQDAEVAA